MTRLAKTVSPPTARRTYEQVSLCFERTDLRPAELACVVAVLAAEKLGLPAPRIEEVLELTGVKSVPFGRLVARRWLVVVTASKPFRYRAHPEAWRRLGFKPPSISKGSAA